MRESHSPSNHRRLWLGLALVIAAAFTLLGFFGREIYRQAPPMPEHIVDEEGRPLFPPGAVSDGQLVWENAGGQTIGSIWGHGAYQAPDWSADWLHREASGLLDVWAQREHGLDYAGLSPEAAAPLRARLRAQMWAHRYVPETGTLTVSKDRARIVARLAAHYDALFGAAPGLAELRAAYAMPPEVVPTPERREQLAAFFFWTAWAAAARRPGQDASYTQNWPHEPLIDNVPTSENLVWSFLSIVLLLAGIGALVWYQAFAPEPTEEVVPDEQDPLAEIRLSPSMRATGKYVLVVAALFVVQVFAGAATAHYTVEGDAFFGLPLMEMLPYALGRTWHVQLALFWIATSFLATGLFLAPAVGGREPKHQALGAHVLFGVLVVVVAGSLLGEGLALHRWLPSELIFWLGHQGFEFLELGRVWQIALYVGLLFWLVLMLRGLWPALTRTDEGRTIVGLFTFAAGAIGLFYGAGFMFGARTHLSVMEYWRWWVVHLWVEGFMEVFATAAIAFIFARLGLVRPAAAGRAALLATAIFLVGGIPGTFHHIYFSGTPSSIMAVGATFSALEVVPLVLVGIEAFHTRSKLDAAPWMKAYTWPIRYFVAVAFWNLVGAGLFGFLINPPIALFYMQGLNTAPVHGHTALFGVYGFLGLGMMLFVTRRLRPRAQWDERMMAVGFWGMNLGLGLMVLLSLLPIGLLQTEASIEVGMWWARSADFMQQPHIVSLKWLRMVGDVVFMAGALAYAFALAKALLPARGGRGEVSAPEPS